MLANLPPERRRRVFAIYIVVTVLGGATVILLLTLLGLLYWMHADVALPDPVRLIHPQATAYCVVEIEPAARFTREISPAVQAALGGENSPVAPLIKQGCRNDNCPMQIVACIIDRGDKPQRTFTVTLGKFPGMFYLKQRDLERRVKEQTISASVRYHNRKAVFESDDWSPFRAVSLAQCSVLRSTEADILTPLIDQLEADTLPVPDAWPDPVKLRLQSPSPANLWGWSRRCPPLSADGILNRKATRALLQFEQALHQQQPALIQASDFRFWGQTFTQGCHLRITFAPATAAQGAQLAKNLPVWLRQHGHRIGITAPEASFDPENKRVELKLRVHLGEP